MLVELFEFQNKALGSLRERQVKAQRRYKQDGEKSIIPFTAPTGAGKTIIMSAFIEALLTILLIATLCLHLSLSQTAKCFILKFK